MSNDEARKLSFVILKAFEHIYFYESQFGNYNTCTRVNISNKKYNWQYRVFQPNALYKQTKKKKS